MSIIGNIKEEIANSVYRKMSTQIQMENSLEYESICDIKNAIKHETSCHLKVYLEIFKAEGFNTNKLKGYLNNAGFWYTDLPFHNKYIATSSLSTIMKSKVNKIVQEGLKINDEIIDNKIIVKEIQELIEVYGAGAIVIKELAQDFKDSEFETLEPHRFYKDDEATYLITYLKREEDEVFYNLIAIEEMNNKVLVTNQNKKIDKKGNVRVLDGKTETVEFNPLFIFDGYENSLDKIKHALALIDLTETVMAVEVKSSEFNIHADEKYFDNGQIVKRDFYRIISQSGSENPPLFQAFQPELRQESYIAIKNNYLQEIANEMGVSVRSLGFSSVNDQVATVALLDEENSIQTINSEIDILKALFNEFLSIYFDNQVAEFQPYYNNSIQFKANVIQTLGNSTSIETKVNILYPYKDEDFKLRETILIKIENSVPLTYEEEQYAIENGLISGIGFSSNQGGS